MSVPDLYVVTVAFLALKKKWFFWENFFFQNFFWKILTLFYATFQCGRYNVKKIKKNFFLPMKNWKNHPKKLLRIGPDHFFPLTSQGHSPQPKIDFPYHEISGPDICCLICDGGKANENAKQALQSNLAKVKLHKINAWVH